MTKSELVSSIAEKVKMTKSEVENVFNPEKNTFFTHGKCTRWVLKDDAGKLIGRVAAFINEKNIIKVKLAKFTPYEDASFLTEKKVYQIKNCDELETADFISIYE
mgnify:CR=1 FL=1